ncbi:ThiF family adenylyltransferase [Bradyrhizobium sp. GCM10028915]|uniref:ThiF family adenylyltransferase n=1 Tax=Bradyrhizobium sp. GCM10028915 TaxID=3273385 RepID=UPI00360C041E
MSLPLEATTAGSGDFGLDAWFASLGDEFAGRVPVGSLRPRMVEGWRLLWRGRELEIQVDADFPFSVATAYLVGYSRAKAEPHVERDGKLCLAAKAVPGDRLRTVQAVVANAIQLLAENETRKHDDDFRDDFGLYWLSWATRGGARVEVLPGLHGADKTILGRAVTTTNGRTLVFPGKAEATKVWKNLTGAPPVALRETPVIAIDPLPAPDRYPETAEELWALVESRSQDGVGLLKRLMKNSPKQAVVVLAGKAPSGREHYAAMYLRRPLDRGGKPFNRQTMRKNIVPSKEATKAIFGRFELDRVATQRMDSSASRLPEGVNAQMTGAKVIIAGCGALGSGVARMLAQAGVEHLRLVDPEDLGWENIRRHELGALAVGTGKAKSLANSIRASLPTIGLVEGFASTFATFAREHPEVLKAADLVISCTGEWAADASVEDALSQSGKKAVAIYGWMEPHALASHAVLIGNGSNFADGFDDRGGFRLPAVAGGKPPPAECGGASTPFGAVELAHAQALVARLALDALRGLASAPAWRSWLADAAAFQEADASVTSGWAAARGQPDEVGGPYEGDWTFS